MNNQITENVQHLLKNESDDLTHNIRLLNNAEKVLKTVFRKSPLTILAFFNYSDERKTDIG